MGVLTGLIRDLTARLGGSRSSTPGQVRELLDKREVDQAALALDSLAPHVPDRELVLLCLRGEVAFRRHDDEAADRLFREALALAPGLADAHYGLSLVMLARSDQESALRHAQFAVNLGSAARFSAQLGLCQLAQGNHVRAKEALMRATRLDPHDKSSWNNLGIVRRALGQLAASRMAFERALEIDPEFDRAADNLRLLDQDIASKRITYRDVVKAQTEAVVAIDPDIEQLRSLRDAGRVDDAIDKCESLCSEHADRVDLVIELAHLYGERGDTQSGIDALQAFVARHDGNIRAVAALGRLLVDHQDFKAARPLIERAHQAEPDNVEIMMSLAEVRTEQGRFADAGALVERANVLSPSLDMKGRLAASLCVRCKYEECLALVDEMLAEEPSVAPDVMGIQVDAMTALGRHEHVLPLLNEALDKNPNDPNRRFLRATVSLLREDFASGWDDYAFRNLQSIRHLRMLPFPLSSKVWAIKSCSRRASPTWSVWRPRASCWRFPSVSPRRLQGRFHGARSSPADKTPPSTGSRMSAPSTTLSCWRICRRVFAGRSLIFPGMQATCGLTRRVERTGPMRSAATRNRELDCRGEAGRS
jgi:tetratricopeptide (TPR) repeat protein